MPSNLRAAVHVAPAIPWRRPNGSIGGPWSPISSTLVYGAHSAILVDTPITIAQTTALADWIADTLGADIKLAYIYVTHGHADHWLGIHQLTQRFPGVQAVATRGTIAHMRAQAAPQAFAASWASQFPDGQIDADYAAALDTVAALPADGGFELEGHALRAVEVGHSDTHDSTVLWCPALRLAVCGDVVYGDVHQMLAFANTAALRDEWIRAIETVEALAPLVVVPGHKKVGEIDGVWHLQRSKDYIRDFGRLIGDDDGAEGKVGVAVKDARELSTEMERLYPTRFNRGALVAGCMAAFRMKEKKGNAKKEGGGKL